MSRCSMTSDSSNDDVVSAERSGSVFVLVALSALSGADGPAQTQLSALIRSGRSNLIGWCCVAALVLSGKFLHSVWS